MFREKGPARMAVEAMLQAATLDNPATPDYIAMMTGVDVSLVRAHIGHAVNKNRAYNVAGKSRGSAAYVWGQPKRKMELTVAAPREPIKYQPLILKPAPVRPGADEHKNCPSRRGEVEVPWMPPYCVGQRQLDPVTKGLL